MTGVIAAGGTLGIMIPPSTIMVIYGIVTETNIGKLFAAGVLPGLLCAGLLMASEGEGFGLPIVEAARRNRLPSVYPYNFFVEAGGLMSYGVDVTPSYKDAADYNDRILKGAKPADLPVQAPVKFDLTISLEAARTLGLSVPAALLARADQVLE